RFYSCASARSGDGVVQRNFANDVVARIGYEEVLSGRIEGDGSRIEEDRGIGAATVTQGVGCAARRCADVGGAASERSDISGRADLADNIVAGVGDEELAEVVGGEARRRVEGCLQGGAAVALGVVAVGADCGCSTGVGGDVAGGIDLADHVVAGIGDVEAAGSVDGNTAWAVQRSRGRRAAIAGISGSVATCEDAGGARCRRDEDAVVGGVSDVCVSCAIEDDCLGTMDGCTGKRDVAGIECDGGRGPGSGNKEAADGAGAGSHGEGRGLVTRNSWVESYGNGAVVGVVGLDSARGRSESEVGLVAGDGEGIGLGRGVFGCEVNEDTLRNGGAPDIDGGEVEAGKQLADARARCVRGAFVVRDVEVALIVGRCANAGVGGGAGVDGSLRARAAVTHCVGFCSATDGTGSSRAAEVAGDHANISGGVIDEPDDVVADVGDEEVGVIVERDFAVTDGYSKGRDCGRGAVRSIGAGSRVSDSGATGARAAACNVVNVTEDRRSDTRQVAFAHVDGADHVVAGVCDKDVAVDINLNIFRSGQQR